MSDPNKKKYRKWYADEFELARKTLADEPGTLEWSQHDYEAFVFKGPAVHLIFYPHKTSALNYHIRVRDSNSKDKERAKALMRALDKAAGHYCTFTSKLGYVRGTNQ